MFPVGELDKTAVREHARALGLPVADKPDSHEICFVPDGDHAAFLERQERAWRTGARSATSRRALVGEHDGVHRFTVGQRKGLGLATGVQLYVVGIDAADRTVTVGPREALERTTLLRVGRELDRGRARQRVHASRRRSAIATPRRRDADAGRDATVDVMFDQPQQAIAPGQAVVFYDGENVVGGGWID